MQIAHLIEKNQSWRKGFESEVTKEEPERVRTRDCTPPRAELEDVTGNPEPGQANRGDEQTA